VLTLWAAVVGEGLGFEHEESLALGRAVAGLNAYSKGVSLGLFQPTPMGRGGRRGERCPIHSFYFLFFSFLIPAENAPKQTQDLVLKSLDPKFSLLYIQLTPKRVLISFRIVSGSE
jgi:hypothetical protein